MTGEEGMIGHPVYDKAMQTLRVCEVGEMSLYGIVYDISHLRHPGGQLFIRACESTDATDLFESVHINHRAATSLLATLPVKRRNDEWTHVTRFQKYGNYARLRDRMYNAFPTRLSRRMSTHDIRILHYTVIALIATHVVLCLSTAWTWHWSLLCLASSVLNTIGGGYGHNAVHRLEPTAMLLDWNGLSSFEWVFEHVVSHHPNVNTPQDHDALSMEPFVRWLPDRPRAFLGDAATSFSTHIIYLISENAVALQGFIGHRLRWRAAQYDAPRWMVHAPWIFVLRCISLLLCFGLRDGLVTFFITMTLAGYYFSVLAHMTHVCVRHRSDFATQQLENTVDLRGNPHLTLFLDRQRLHHLFPVVDHTRLLPSIDICERTYQPSNAIGECH